MRIIISRGVRVSLSFFYFNYTLNINIQLSKILHVKFRKYAKFYKKYLYKNTTYNIQDTTKLFITTSAASEIIATTTIYDDLRIGIIQ